MKYGCMNQNRVNNPFNRLAIVEIVILAYGGHILAVLGGKASPLTRQQCIFVMWGWSPFNLWGQLLGRFSHE